MLEVKEVLRLWREGVPTKRVVAQLGLDPKDRPAVSPRRRHGRRRSKETASENAVATFAQRINVRGCEEIRTIADRS